MQSNNEMFWFCSGVNLESVFEMKKPPLYQVIVKNIIINKKYNLKIQIVNWYKRRFRWLGYFGEDRGTNTS